MCARWAAESGGSVPNYLLDAPPGQTRPELFSRDGGNGKVCPSVLSWSGETYLAPQEADWKTYRETISADSMHPSTIPGFGHSERHIVRYVILLAALISLSACGSGAETSTPTATQATTPASNAILDALRECGPARAYTLADENRSAIVEVSTGYDADQELEEAQCFIKAVGFSDADLALVNNTTALAGQQEATIDGYTMSWSYHPDNGLNMVITAD